MKRIVLTYGPLAVLFIVMAAPVVYSSEVIQRGLGSAHLSATRLSLGFATLMVVAWLFPRLVTRMLALCLPIGLIVCIVFNTKHFAQNNGHGTYTLELHPSGSLLNLAKKSPQIYAREVLAPYFLIHDHVGCKTVITYDKSILDPYRIKMDARVEVYEVQEYRHELTDGEVEQLLAMEHEVMKMRGGTECVFMLDVDLSASDETCYVMSRGERHFLVPAHLVAR